MMIRAARQTELDAILEIYAYARRFMEETGNPTQWQGGYPARELLEQDIEKGHLYVMKQCTRGEDGSKTAAESMQQTERRGLLIRCKEGTKKA